jgi:hypothetical protein
VRYFISPALAIAGESTDNEISQGNNDKSHDDENVDCNKRHPTISFWIAMFVVAGF